MEKHVPIKFEKRKHWRYSHLSGQLPQSFMSISTTWWAPSCYVLLCNGDGLHRNKDRMGKKTNLFLVVPGSLK